MDKYTMLRELGQGAFGVVYEAECEVAGITRKRALKCLTLHSWDGVELVRREIDALRQVGSHPNIMQYIESIIDDSILNSRTLRVWLVLEFCNGGTFDSFILKRNLDRATTLGLLCDMAEGVAYLHGRNIVHRDLKPENILVENSGRRPIVKIADFGLARVCGQAEVDGFDLNHYYMETIAGTLYYWPPEMLRHTLAQQAELVLMTYTAKTDVWAMGVIIAAILGRMIDPIREGKLQPVIPVDERAIPVAEAVITYPGFPLADMLMKSETPRSPVKTLALSMLAADPHQRPTSQQVLRRLRSIIRLPDRVQLQGPPAMPSPPPYTAVEMPPPPPYTSAVVPMPVQRTQPESENQTPWKDRIASCCTACWKWDSSKKYYSLCGKGPGWVIVVLLLWIICIAAVVMFFPIFYCYYLYCYEYCCDDS